MKHLLHYIFTLILLFAAYPSSAQTAVDGWSIESIHGPSQLGIVDTIPVDINHDGLMDVVSASIDDGHLRAYINQGNSVFEQQYISTDVLGAYRVSATDFNNDGEVDFLLPSIETDEIIALIAEPGAKPYGYRKQIIVEGVLLPTDAQAGDFNNDGLMDVVSLSFEANIVLFHLQDDSGQFGNQRLAEMVLKPRKLVVADFNNDGMVDVLVASSEDNSIRFFENLGLANFTEHLISDQMTGARYLAPCDYNSDELIDFVVSATDDNDIFLFANLDGAVFLPTIIDKEVPGANSLHCANIDNDSEMELIAIASSIGSIYTYELSDKLNKNLIANTRDGYLSVNSIDPNNTGSQQILTQAYYENRNLTYSPTQLNSEQVIWEDFPEGASAVDTGDINGDGTGDIVVTSFRDDRVQWYDGLTNEHHIIAENIDGAADLVVVDLDEDGNVDVLSAASFGNAFYWHKNLGNSVFQTIIIFDDAKFANGLAVGDINADGKLDVIGTSGTDDSVRWFDRNGLSFTVYLIDDSSDAPNDIKTADFNKDGYVDLLASYYFSNEVVIYYAVGGASFTKAVIDNDFYRAYDLQIEDLNGDGELDFMASSANAGQLKYYINNDVVFTSIQAISNLPQLSWFQYLTNNYKLIAKSKDTKFENISVFDMKLLVDLRTSFSVTLAMSYAFSFFSDRSQVFLIVFDDLIFIGQFD